MKKKGLVIGGIVAATLLVGGWALAQSARSRWPGGMTGEEWDRECMVRWGLACGVKWALA